MVDLPWQHQLSQKASHKSGLESERTGHMTLKASINSSSVSVSFIFLAINDKNSGKSIVPFPSASTLAFQKEPGKCKHAEEASPTYVLLKQRIKKTMFEELF